MYLTFRLLLGQLPHWFIEWKWTRLHTQDTDDLSLNGSDTKIGTDLCDHLICRISEDLSSRSRRVFGRQFFSGHCQRKGKKRFIFTNILKPESVPNKQIQNFTECRSKLPPPFSKSIMFSKIALTTLAMGGSDVEKRKKRKRYKGERLDYLRLMILGASDAFFSETHGVHTKVHLHQLRAMLFKTQGFLMIFQFTILFNKISPICSSQY